MAHWFQIVWFVVNLGALIVAFGYLQVVTCRQPSCRRSFVLGDILLGLFVIRRINTLIVDLVPELPKIASHVDRYAWPMVVTFTVLLLCIELHTEFSTTRENHPDDRPN